MERTERKYSVDISQCADSMLNRIVIAVKDELKKNSPRIETAIIQNINQDGTIDVYLPSDPDSVFTRIQNQSVYQDLQVGDGVELLLKNGRFSNCWIIAKHGLPVPKVLDEGANGGITLDKMEEIVLNLSNQVQTLSTQMQNLAADVQTLNQKLNTKVPNTTAADNGKVLQVVNGSPAWGTLSTTQEEVS